MLSSAEEAYILDRAYVPEHVVSLMIAVSGGEPFLIDDCLVCRQADWAVLVGYPLEDGRAPGILEKTVDKLRAEWDPRSVSIIAPHLPSSFDKLCRERAQDEYFTLHFRTTPVKSDARRATRKAEGRVRIERTTVMGSAHRALTAEFIERVAPPLRIRNLFQRMPDYVGRAGGAWVINAWDDEGHLTAFFVVDSAAARFATYVIGAHSRKYYIPGASDLLCQEMIAMSWEWGKDYIHLGLGVNEGIRRFKKKWGGVPTLAYDMCEIVLRRPTWRETVTRLVQGHAGR